MVVTDRRSPGDDPEILEAFIGQVDELVRVAQGQVGCAGSDLRPQELARLAHRCRGDAEFLDLPEFTALARVLEHSVEFVPCVREGAELIALRCADPRADFSGKERAFLQRWTP